MTAYTGPTEEAVREALRSVEDPELHRDLIALDMVKRVQVRGDAISLEIELTTPACPLKHVIGEDVRKALRERWPAAQVEVRFGARVRSGAAKGKPERQPLGEVKNVILVASGKGGVGKSTVAVNLAYALQQQGAEVGLADADVYGPSLHVMVSSSEAPRPGQGQRLIPPRVNGVPLISMGLLVEPDQAMVWRGPMLANAALQLLTEVEWGPLDYLIVDLPPGTGDIQLSISQRVQVAGAVIVSTPQDVALADVVRAKTMFDKVDIRTLGVIENMSYFVCDGCGKRHEIFASGGAEAAAQRLGTPFLGAVPLVTALRQGADEGVPLVVAQPDSELAEAFRDIAGQVAARVAVLASSVRQGAHLRVVE